MSKSQKVGLGHYFGKHKLAIAIYIAIPSGRSM